MPRTGQQAAPCPPLLKCLYGEERVVPLRDLLLALSRLSRNAAHLGATLVQPHDHRDYAQRLLGSTLCVVNAGAPALRDGFSLQQMSNQAEVRIAGCRRPAAQVGFPARVALHLQSLGSPSEKVQKGPHQLVIAQAPFKSPALPTPRLRCAASGTRCGGDAAIPAGQRQRAGIWLPQGARWPSCGLRPEALPHLL